MSILPGGRSLPPARPRRRPEQRPDDGARDVRHALDILSATGAFEALERGTRRRFGRAPDEAEVARLARWVILVRTQQASLDLATDGLADLAFEPGERFPDALFDPGVESWLDSPLPASEVREGRRGHD